MGLTANYPLSNAPTGRDAVPERPAGDRLSPDEWYDLIVQASADGSWFYDVENGAIHYSPSFLNIVDFSLDQGYCTPDEFMERIHPEDRDRYKRALGRHLRGDTEVFQSEIRVHGDSGEPRWILSRGIARRDKDGYAYCMFGSIVDITRRRQLEDSLRTVALSTVDQHAGPEFFESSVSYLAQTLNCDCAIIGKLDDPGSSVVRAVAVYQDGELKPNFEYDLAGTPCENVIGFDTCVYLENVAHMFPDDAMLADEGFQGYVGSPLIDSNGRPLGVIAALFRRPIPESSMTEDLLKIFAARVSAELERVRKEQELARSERRYRELYHHTPVMLHSIDRDGCLLAVSDYWLQCLGYTEAQVLGRRTTDFFTEASRRYAQEVVLPEFFRTGMSRSVPYQVVKADGDVIDVLLSAVTEFDDAGNIERSLVVMTDVTDQRRAEAEYRDIFNNATEGIYRTTLEGRLLRANPALVRMHGFETEAELIESVTDIAEQWYVNADDRARLTERMNREGRVTDFEVEIYRRATGERIWVIENGRAVYGDDGAVAYYEGTIHDVTERRRLEAEYRDIFDNVGEGIYRSTPDGKLVKANPALARLQGFDRPEDLMAAINNLNTDWYLDPGARRALRQRLDGQGYVDDFEAQIRPLNRDGSIWTSETVRVTRDSEGNVLYYEGMVRDVTAEHQSRELTQHRNTVLELIARDASLDEILHEIAAIADKQRKTLSAGIFLIREGRLHSAAASSGSEPCIRAVNGKTPGEVGGAIQAALHGEHEVVESGLEEGSDATGGFTALMRRSGYRSLLATPIRDQQGTVLGVVAACARQSRGKGRASREVLQEMAQMASIAIEQHRLAEALRHQAHYDSLTGLPNRALLSDRLDQAIQEANRGGYPVGVLLLDLDEFKLVNDSLGHSAGDQLLQEVSASLRECLRAGDTVARLGGDEFVMIVPLKHGGESCTDVAERLLATLQNNFRVAGREVKARPSIGISLYPQDGHTPEILLQASDTAMYAAKHTGKNQYRYFAERMNRQVSERLQIESELQDAIRNNELELHYQPRIVLDTETYCGAEALLRWRHPERGLLSAFKFIGIAERGPLISEIDRIVLRQAAERLAAWQREGRELVLSVNVSARELHADGFAADVALTLERAGVDPSGLELEITENVLMRDYERTRRQLVALKERAPGLRIAVDDFGSGYSSLNYLRQLPIDTLKIDGSFVTDLGQTDDATAGAIAKTIVDLGHNLGLTVVAEGVETREQAECLRQYGCHQAQGFFYDKPLPASEFERRFPAPPTKA